MHETAGHKLLLRDCGSARVDACTNTSSEIVCFVAMKQKGEPVRRDSFVTFAGTLAAEMAPEIDLTRPTNLSKLDRAFTPGGVVLQSTETEPLYVLIQTDGRIVAIGDIFNSGTDTANLNLARYLTD